MWYLIKRTVKDPHSPSVLKVQPVLDGETKEYVIQEDVENAIQRECKSDSLLLIAHRSCPHY
jgi:hypothetical protein